MTEVSLVPGHEQPPESAGLTARPPLTLAEEHVLLLWQVTTRVEELRPRPRAADGPVPSWRRWPATSRPRCCARRLTRRRCCFQRPQPGKRPGWPGTMPGCVRLLSC